MGLIGKTLSAIGTASEAGVRGMGNLTIGLGKGVAKAGKAIGKGAGNKLTDDLVEGASKKSRELTDATFYERLLGRKLNAGGIAVATIGTMGVSTVGAALDSTKPNKLGHISVGDNLDRLVSYDGSGFINNINQVSGGDPEIMQDIVKNTFNKSNQMGVSGDIVFALHNMREG